MKMESRTALPRNAALTAAALVLLVGIFAAPSHPAFAQAPLAAPSSGLLNPRAIAYSPMTGKVYAVDTSHGAVEIYNDANGQSHSVKVGAEPISIAVNTATGAVYVANGGDGSVSVIDGRTDAVTATVPIGGRLYSIAADSSTGKVYATHTFGNQLSIIDGATNAVSAVKTGGEDLIAINSQTGTIYLLGYGGAVKVLDAKSLKFVEQPVGRHAWGLTLDGATGTVYVTRIENADVAALKSGSTTVESLPAGAIPCAIAIDAKANLLYVANNGDNTVTATDAATGRKVATVAVGRHPKAIAFDAERNLVYVANTSDNTVTVIDGASKKAVATLPAGKSPSALAVVPGSNHVYVFNETDDGSSTVVDVGNIRKTGV
ncbi:MAG TPA: YncE family protein [Terracidiphilus sp.]